jgi:hypothetical protein
VKEREEGAMELMHQFSIYISSMTTMMAAATNNINIIDTILINNINNNLNIYGVLY